MATLNKTGRPAYMYEESTQTWYQVSGIVSTGANYQWVGTHQFDNNTTFVGAVNAIKRFNSFLNPAARSAAITSPPDIGLITFIQQDALGATINRFEYWNGTSWIPYADPATTVTLTGTQTLTNKTLTSPLVNGGTFSSTYLIAPEEKWNISATAVTSTTTVDYLTAQNWQYTTASTAGASTMNIRGSSTVSLSSLLATGDSITLSVHVATGATTPAFFNAVQVDGTAVGVTVRWQYGTTPTNATTTISGYDMYSFTVIKTSGSTYTVLASVTKW